MHGPNYRVQITVASQHLDENGLLVDFIKLKGLMARVVDYFDHRFINDLPPFDVLNAFGREPRQILP